MPACFEIASTDSQKGKMTRKLITVVTGSNRGIGEGIVKLLATTQHARPLIIYATSRAGNNNPNIKAEHDNEIRYEKLDVSDRMSIVNFLRIAVKKDPGSRAIDILINNAGVNLNQNEGYDEAEKTINANYRALRDMCQLFLDAGNMKTNPGARIVNVSSTGSALGIHDQKLQERFRNAQSVQEVDGIADEYLRAYKEGSLAQHGFGTNGGGAISYQVSKACVNALTQVLAKQNPDVQINCCCPGWVDTDMGNILGKPPKTLEQGARIPVRLAIGDIGKESGRYWGNDGVFDTGDGKAIHW
jgi:carbonyl reductase 1